MRNRTFVIPSRLLAATLFFSSWSVSVIAEEEFDVLGELSLEDLLNIEVETATKTAEKSSLSPAIMTVVTSQDIDNYGYSSVAEALSHVASFVDNYDLAVHNFGVRGINSGVRSGSRTIKFMIDGQAIAFRSTSQNFIDKELIPMDMIERIEVVRGPVSALYGANAFLGVVNIVSKSGAKLAENGGSVGLKLSSTSNAGSGYTASATYGRNNDTWDYSIGMSASDEDRSDIALPRRSPAYESISMQQSASDDSEPLSLYARSKYQIDETSSIKMSGHYQQLSVDNPFSDINPLQPEGATKIALGNMYFRTDYDIALSENVTAHAFMVYSQGETLDKDKIEVGAESFFLERRFGYDGFDIGAEMFVTFREKDSLLVGFDSKRDNQKVETFTRVDRLTGDRTELNPARDETLTDIGLYAQYLMQVKENWRAVAGFRLDDDSVIGQQSSARLGVVGQLSNDIILKVLAGSSFQAPSPELLYRTAVQAGDIIGNSDLSAQKAETLEVSVAMPLSNFIHMTLTYFNTKVDELVVFESDGSNLFANNSSGSTTDGLEVELRMLWQGINAYFNYTWQETEREHNPFSLFVLEQRKDGELYPEQAANLGMSYFWKEPQINLSWNNRWVGKRDASSLNVLFINQNYELDSYLDSTLTISTDRFSMLQDKKGTLRLQFKDMFDSNYVNPGFGGIEFPSLGRQVLLSFEQRF